MKLFGYRIIKEKEYQGLKIKTIPLDIGNCYFNYKFDIPEEYLEYVVGNKLSLTINGNIYEYKLVKPKLNLKGWKANTKDWTKLSTKRL